MLSHSPILIAINYHYSGSLSVESAIKFSLHVNLISFPLFLGNIYIILLYFSLFLAYIWSRILLDFLLGSLTILTVSRKTIKLLPLAGRNCITCRLGNYFRLIDYVSWSFILGLLWLHVSLFERDSPIPLISFML